MATTHNNISKLQQLKLHLFLSAAAINLFSAVIIIANSLSIRYFLYTTPMAVKIELLPPVWTTLLWIGSLYALYTTKEVVKQNPSLHRINHSLNIALVGSFFLIFSIILTASHSFAQLSTRPLPDQLSFWISTAGFILSFAGSFIALLIIMTQTRSLARIFLLYLFSLLIPIEILSLIHWVVYPFDVISYSGIAWQGAFVELQFFYAVYPLIFWLFIAFLFSWIWIPLLKRVNEKVRLQRWAGMKTFMFESSSSKQVSGETTGEKSSGHETPAGQRLSTGQPVPIALLLSSLVLGAFIAYYPYLSRRPGLVGTDSLGYYYTLTAIDSKGLYEAAQLANEINPARVLYHMMLYALRNLSQLPASTIIELMPIITIVVNALAVFWFARTAEKNALLASIAAVFSVFSFTTTISMHAGTLANWLAIALGFVMFGLVLEFHEEKKLKLLSAAILVLAAILLIHYWSGLFFMVVLGCYAFLVLLEPLKLRVKLLAVLILSILAVLTTFLASVALSRFLTPYTIPPVFESSYLPEALVAFWTRFPALIDVWFFGALANPVMISLALVGVAVCFNQKSNSSRLLVSWIIVGSVLSVLVSRIGEGMSQWLTWRTVYLLPFQILAALGLFFFVSKLGIPRDGERHVQHDGQGQRHVWSFSRFLKNQDVLVVFYLAIDYVVSAILALNFPVWLSAFVFSFLVLSIILHFKSRGRPNASILVFVFVLFVALALFNYTLRSLAPLAVNRWSP